MTGLNDFRNRPEPTHPRCLCGHFYHDHPDDVCRLCRHVCVYRPDKPIESPTRAADHYTDKGHHAVPCARWNCECADFAAAPLSTLPEHPDAPKPLTANERATVRLYLDGKFVQLPNGLRTMHDQLARYEATVSSLERELDGVRKERDQWKGRAEWLWQAPFADAPHRDRDGRAWFRETPDVVYEDVWTAIDAAISALRERSE